jgi:signal transduction histidine kinase
MDYDNISFPNNELGDIASKVLKMYQELEIKTQQVGLERERLMKHFHHFEEGIAIFSAQRQKVYSNPRFLQYLNTILDITTSSVNAIWSEREFKPIQEFLDQQQNQNIWNAETSVYRDTLSVGGAHYAVQVVVYSDRSFEISLSDVTKAEKNRLLKQQMSHNISHELRTPVSSIRGFLETLITCENLSAERRKDFLQRALLQVERLSDLIRDVALISKIEEAAATLPRENVDLRLLVGETIEELQSDLDKQEMSVLVDFPEEMTICGNYSLLHSIFRNLLENPVRYAGQGTRVEISCYKKNAEFLFFRYFNNGEQIPEEHLPRLFERFYRITEGRTRDCGGTGLGLSIVKNAVSFHSGDIIVKNLLDQGVEFLFTLKRGK